MTEVTIGLAVYNGAATLEQALDCLLAQTFKDYVICISDNASTDDTELICRRYAAKFANIKYTRQPSNQGPIENFRRVLMGAKTPYFMWAACDDLWAPRFIAENYAYLSAHPDYVASQSRILYLNDGFPSRMGQGTYAMRADARRNVAKFFSSVGCNGRFYSLFRTEYLKRSFPETEFFGFDWAVSAASLAHGRHNEVPEILMLRDETIATAYANMSNRENKTTLQRALPLLNMANYLIRRRQVPVSGAFLMAIARSIIKLGIRHATYKLNKRALQRLHRPQSQSGFVNKLATLTAKITAPGIKERMHAAVALVPYVTGKPSPVTPIAARGHGWTPIARPEIAPDISVLIVAKDQLSQLLSLTQTLDAGCGEKSFELFVADHGSSDATELAFRARQDLTYIRFEQSAEMSSIVTTFAKRATGQHLVILEADVKLHAECLAELSEALMQVDLTSSPLLPEHNDSTPLALAISVEVLKEYVHSIVGKTLSEVGASLCRQIHGCRCGCGCRLHSEGR